MNYLAYWFQHGRPFVILEDLFTLEGKVTKKEGEAKTELFHLVAHSRDNDMASTGPR